MLSGIYSGWKKMDKCEAELLTILKYDPTNATANNDLGYIWADQSKNLQEAEAMIRKAIDIDREQRKTQAALDKDNAAYIDSLGWVLFRRGDVDGRHLKELERSQVALPEGDDPALWDHLGDVYFRVERYPQALSAWQRSVELYEDFYRPCQQDRRYVPQDEQLQGREAETQDRPRARQRAVIASTRRVSEGRSHPSLTRRVSQPKSPCRESTSFSGSRGRQLSCEMRMTNSERSCP